VIYSALQEATAAKQQNEIEALAAGLQKVSAQVEMSSATPQMVNNRMIAVRLRLSQLARVLVPFRHVAWFIANTNHSAM